MKSYVQYRFFVVLLVLLFFSACQSPNLTETSEPENLVGQAITADDYLTYAPAIQNFTVTPQVVQAVNGSIVLNISVQDHAVFSRAFYSIDGQEWKEFALTGPAFAGDWLADMGNALLVLPVESVVESEDNYISLYSCSLENQSWHCSDKKWQIHEFSVELCEDGTIQNEQRCQGGAWYAAPEDPQVPISENTLNNIQSVVDQQEMQIIISDDTDMDVYGSAMDLAPEFYGAGSGGSSSEIKEKIVVQPQADTAVDTQTILLSVGCQFDSYPESSLANTYCSEDAEFVLAPGEVTLSLVSSAQSVYLEFLAYSSRELHLLSQLNVDELLADIDETTACLRFDDAGDVSVNSNPCDTRSPNYISSVTESVDPQQSLSEVFMPFSESLEFLSTGLTASSRSTQNLQLGSSLRLSHSKNAQDTYGAYVELAPSEELFSYEISFDPPLRSSVSQYYRLPNLHNKLVSVLGDTYRIVDSRFINGDLELTLVKGQTVSLEQGQTISYSIDDKTYEVTHLVSGRDSSKLLIDGEVTDTLEVGDSDVVGNSLQVTLVDLMYKDRYQESDPGSVIDVVLDSTVVEFGDGEIKINSDRVANSNARVEYDQSQEDIFISEIGVSIHAPRDSQILIAPGQSLSQTVQDSKVLLGSWDVRLHPLNSEEFEVSVGVFEEPMPELDTPERCVSSSRFECSEFVVYSDDFDHANVEIELVNRHRDAITIQEVVATSGFPGSCEVVQQEDSDQAISPGEEFMIQCTSQDSLSEDQRHRLEFTVALTQFGEAAVRNENIVLLSSTTRISRLDHVHEFRNLDLQTYMSYYGQSNTKEYFITYVHEDTGVETDVRILEPAFNPIVQYEYMRSLLEELGVEYSFDTVVMQAAYNSGSESGEVWVSEQGFLVDVQGVSGDPDQEILAYYVQKYAPFSLS